VENGVPTTKIVWCYSEHGASWLGFFDTDGKWYEVDANGVSLAAKPAYWAELLHWGGRHRDTVP